jgi:hypothetical protein
VAAAARPIPTITSTGADATTAVNRITDGLRTHGLDSQMSDIHVFTTKTDPSHQLGRPHSYVARAAFTDTTLPAAATRSAGLARGGTVEVFTMAADARAAAGHAADELPGETDLLSGVVLLRLSPRVPSTLVETYRTALHETTGTPAQVVR